MKIITEVSARHVHLSEKDFKKLFGNTKLEILKKLSQPGEFSTKQIIKLKDIKIRVVGPLRKNSQIEISKTDAFKLSIDVPLRLSGNIKGVKKIKVQGPKGITEIPIIIAQRHIHLSEKDVKKFKLKNNQKVSVKINSKRVLTFHNVLVRVNKNYKPAFHIDTDEANAAGINKKTFGEIIK